MFGKMLILLSIVLPLVCGQAANDTKNINPTACGKRLNQGSKIVGGVASAKGDWGWQIGLYYRGSFICGGSLINSQWVVTAAHCAVSTTASYFVVKLGYWNRKVAETWSKSIAVGQVIVHESFNSSTLRNDIALLKLKSAVTYNKYIVPVCIPAAGYSIPIGNVVYATGWGSTNESSLILPIYLMQVNFTIISEADCIKANDNTVSYMSQICAGKKNGNKDTCQGDSGGPLVTQDSKNKKWYLGGLTSWGYGCSGAGVYTRVSAFVSWIKGKIAKF